VRRISPASQLVLVAVAIAVLSLLAAIGRLPSSTPSPTASPMGAAVATAPGATGPGVVAAGGPTPAAIASGTPQSPASPSSAPLPTSPSGPATPRPTATPRPSATSRPARTPPPPTAAPPPRNTIAGLLATLHVAAENRTGYDRSLFPLWIDANGDGCDTRHEVLIRDAVVTPTVGASCSLSGGEWISPYDDLVFTDPSKLDIDHMVPLAEAWDSGASAWTTARRRAYANDLDVDWALLAVSASSNRSKGDDDPAQWLPPDHAFWCTYAADWVEVKARWSLSVDPAEHAELAQLAADCPTTRVAYVPAP
jgi:Protein of unknown function (DUF1524)